MALFENEADLVARYCEHIEHLNTVSEKNGWDRGRWTAYHEWAEWDLLMVHDSGAQVGIEAKMTLNAKVLDQALPYMGHHWDEGPDFRAVLVAREGLQNHLENIANHIGIVIIRASGQAPSEWSPKGRYNFNPTLPDFNFSYSCREWPAWYPARRHRLPDYVPDVTGGRAAPVKLTPWKISAIKLLILLEKRGFVTRADMKKLEISPTVWTQTYLARGAPGCYVRCRYTPDFRAEHPKNFAEIEADFQRWGADFPMEKMAPLELKL